MMTLVKASALTVGFVGAFAIGIWAGPHVMHRMPASVAVATPAPAPPVKAATHRAMAPASRSTAPRAASLAAEPAVAPVALSSPALRARIKPVLNHGTNMTQAMQGFASAEQFATVAHASHDANIPFILLKHRVLVDHTPLAVAINESQPWVNGRVEANLARAEALVDLAALHS